MGITSSAPTDFPGSASVREIKQPDPNPFGLAPRALRMVGDAMAPTVRDGDLLMAVPVSAYHCEGLYLLTFGAGGGA